jgi:UDP-2,4-diacetamido-2,4,6-trideoxy-beta-L-altropyranose hydrolase
MAELMAQADLALGAGGATTWERLCLGLPSLVVTIAENQRPFTENLHQDKYLNYLGTKDSLSVEKIQIELKQSLENSDANKLQSQKGMQIVSGDGRSQVVEVIKKYTPSERIVII